MQQDQYACYNQTHGLVRISLANRHYATRLTIFPFSCANFSLQFCRGHLADGAGRLSAQDLQSLCPQCGRMGSLSSSSHFEQRQRSRWRRLLSLRTLSGTSQPGIVRESRLEESMRLQFATSFNSYLARVDLSPNSEFVPAESLSNSMQPSERIKSPTQICRFIFMSHPRSTLSFRMSLIFVYFLLEIDGILQMCGVGGTYQISIVQLNQDFQATGKQYTIATAFIVHS